MPTGSTCSFRHSISPPPLLHLYHLRCACSISCLCTQHNHPCFVRRAVRLLDAQNLTVTDASTDKNRNHDGTVRDVHPELITLLFSRTFICRQGMRYTVGRCRDKYVPFMQHEHPLGQLPELPEELPLLREPFAITCVKSTESNVFINIIIVELFLQLLWIVFLNRR